MGYRRKTGPREPETDSRSKLPTEGLLLPESFLCPQRGLLLNTERPPTAIEGPRLLTKGLPAPRECPPIAIKQGPLLPTEGRPKHREASYN